MQQRRLGQRGPLVSAVGLGCMGLSHGYGAATDEAQAVRFLEQAFDAGCTLFDTAEVYGTPEDPHHNERLVGKALSHCRDRVVIVTKFGLRFDEAAETVPKPIIPDGRPETIRRSV